MTLIKQDWVPLFHEFIRYIRINSKEVPAVDKLGAPLNLWPGQQIALDTVVSGLEHRKHIFVFGKARQQGISTLFECLDIFWLATHPGLMGAYVIDKEKNLPGIRDKIRRYFESFPPGFFGRKFAIENNNKEFMLFSNGSRLDFLTAGIGKKQTHWGEGKGYAFAHLTEISKFGNVEGLESFKATLSESNPDRLFIYESQSNGLNHWKDLYEEAGKDEFRQCRNFIGFWGNPYNKIEKTDRAWQVYGVADPDPAEEELIEKVKSDYGFKVSREQLAWWRHQHDTTQSMPALLQKYPWTIEQSFVATGHSFFSTAQLSQELEKCSEIEFTGYKYVMGNDFWKVVCEPIYNANRIGEVTLRVWEEPDPDGVYAIGVDPAYGRGEFKDRHCISVIRCFGDKVMQVAEWADNEIDTRQAAWVLAHLAGAYKNCVVNVESAPGPGGVIMNELENLRDRMRIDPQFEQKAKGTANWEDFLEQARWYLYKKPDHWGAGNVKGWESNFRTKSQIMNQLRDKFVTDCVVIKSKPLVEEMLSVIRDGDKIEAPESSNDDRVIALALAIRGWIDSMMMNLLTQGEMFDNYVKAKNGVPIDKATKFMNNVVRDFFRNAEEIAALPKVNPHQQWLKDRGFI